MSKGDNDKLNNNRQRQGAMALVDTEIETGRIKGERRNEMKKKHAEWVCHSFNELEDAFHAIKSLVAGDTLFMAQALLFIAKQLEKPPEKKTKRKPSAWQKFLSEGLRSGKSIQTVAAEWQAKKSQ